MFYLPLPLAFGMAFKSVGDVLVGDDIDVLVVAVAASDVEI